MGKVRCRANNPATCRTHGTGAAIEVIDKKLDSNRLSFNKRWSLTELKNRAENPDDTKVAMGLTVEYEDGTNEIFVGDSTDTYHQSDYRFYSVDSDEGIEGIAIDEDNDNHWDAVTSGKRSAANFKREFAGAEGYTLRKVSPGEETGYNDDKKIKRIIVL
jgi:hypothetical protein